MKSINVKFSTADEFETGPAAQATTGRTYSYYVTAAQAATLAEGKHELAVVQAPGDDGGFKVVKIVGVPSEKPASAEKHIIALVSLAEFKAQQERVKEAKILRARIEQRANELVEEARLKALAESSGDPALKAMLDELKALGV